MGPRSSSRRAPRRRRRSNEPPMTGGFGAARIVVLLFGLTLLVAGIALIGLEGGAGTITGLWVGGTGLVIMVAALLERVRYRSEATDRAGDPAGVAGGEPLGTR